MQRVATFDNNLAHISVKYFGFIYKDFHFANKNGKSTNFIANHISS